ncbi:hypothetical protein OG21DRAFT_1370149, partial [Imleria badia]
LVVLLFCLWEWKGREWQRLPDQDFSLVYIFKHVTVIGVYIAMFIIGFLSSTSLYYLSQFFWVALG